MTVCCANRIESIAEEANEITKYSRQQKGVSHARHFTIQRIAKKQHEEKKNSRKEEENKMSKIKNVIAQQANEEVKSKSQIDCAKIFRVLNTNDKQKKEKNRVCSKGT